MFKFLSSFTGWYFSRKALPYWAVLSLDCLIVLLSSLLGAYIELRGEFMQSLGAVSAISLLTVLLYTISFRIFHTYSGIIRYSSFVDLQHVVAATAVGAIIESIVLFGLSFVVSLPVSGFWTIGVTFFASTLLMWFMRILVKIMFENFRLDLATPVAIYGTKAGGISLASALAVLKKSTSTVAPAPE